MKFFRRKRAEPEEKIENNQEVSVDILKALLGLGEIDREKAMNIPSLAGAILKITDKVAAIPIKLYKKEGDDVTEVKNDRRVYLLNNETGDTLNAYEMKHAMIMDYFLGKGGYAYINKFGNEIESLHYVSEEHISFESNSDVIFKDYNFLIQGKRYYPHEFVRILRNTKDGKKGLSIIEESQKLLGVAYNSIVYEGNLVKTGGNKKGFLKSERRLTQEKMDKLKESWRKMYSNNSENVVVLNQGLDFKEASNTSVEMQLNENKKTNGTEISKVVGIPPAIIEGKATEMDEKIFIKYELDNLLRVFTTALNASMLLESEKGKYYFEADTDDLNKSDIEKRYSAYGTGLEKGFLQVDEVRAKEKLAPLGLKYIKLGLQDGLLDPETGKVYVLNTNATVDLNDIKKGEIHED